MSHYADPLRSAISDALSYSDDHPVGMEAAKDPVADAISAYLAGWDKTTGAILDDISEVLAETIQRRFGTEAQAEAARAEGQGAVGLDKKLLRVVTFGGDEVKLFTVNGQYIRTPIEAGGLGCLNFTMGMNGYAARDPMYPGAPEWCAEDEVCLHNLLSPVDFMAVLIHELFERWGMKAQGLSYGEAHEQVANLAEQSARRVLASPQWQQILA